MNQLIITEGGLRNAKRRWFTVERNGVRTPMTNEMALNNYLISEIGMTADAVNSIFSALVYELGPIVVNLDHVELAPTDVPYHYDSTGSDDGIPF